MSKLRLSCSLRYYFTVLSVFIASFSSFGIVVRFNDASEYCRWELQALAIQPPLLVIGDNDNDGVLDENDLDDDNDGILDTAEMNCLTTIPVAQDPNPSVTVDDGIVDITYTELTTTLGTATEGGYTYVYPEGLGTAEIAFAPAAVNLEFYLVDMDRLERVYLDVFDASGALVPDVTSYVTVLGASLTVATDATHSCDVSSSFNTSVDSFEPQVTVRFVFPFPVSKIRMDLYSAAVGSPGYIIETLCVDRFSGGDALADRSDNDSDADGCPDALEGNGGFVLTDIDANGQLTGSVNGNGVPIVAGAGQADVSAYSDLVHPAICNASGVPDAIDDAGGNIPEDGANGSVNILANDIDPDGNPSAPTNGPGQFTVDLNVGTLGIQITDTDATGVWSYDPATGVITFDPANNFFGAVSHIYQLCDPGGSCNSAFITFNVTPVNDPPTAVDDAFDINEDGVPSVNVASNDGDIDNTNAQLTWSLVNGGTAAANGTIIFSPNGNLTYIPNVNASGTVSFTYQVCDLGPLCATATATIIILEISDPPDAISDIGATLVEDGPNGTVNIIANDTDPEGNPTAPTNGVGQFTVDINTGLGGVQTTNTTAAGVWTYDPATGVVTFDPANNYNGTATIQYQLCDPSGLCDIANISFVVTAVPDAPDAVDDNGGVLIEDGANGTVNIIANDTDPEGNPTPPTNGLNQFKVDLDPVAPGIQTTLTNTLGTWTYATATGILTFNPANNYYGTATIAYRLCDPTGLCDVANITFIVTSLNDPPDAVDDIVLTPLVEDGANGTVNILSNDTDPDGTVSAPTNGPGQYIVDLDPANPGYQLVLQTIQGFWSYNTTTGVVTFNPANNYFGTATTPYVLCDTDGGCDQATITFTVSSVNDLPDAQSDFGGTLLEDGMNGSVDILANDTDLDGDPTGPTNGPGQFTVDLNLGTPGIQLTITNATGVWTYDPATGIVTFDPKDNYYGTAQLTYVLCDPAGACDQAVITFNVDPVNDPPIVNDDFDNTTQNGIVFTHVVANDTDSLDPNGGIDLTSITIITGPFNGTANALNNGSISYEPDLDYIGLDSLQYVVCDLGYPLPVICDTAWFVITVDDLSPLAFNDQGVVNEDDQVVIDVLVNDVTPTGILVIGSVAILDPPTDGTAVVNPDGTITYTPDPDFNGIDDFTYIVCNDSGYCSPAIVFVDVIPVNDPPVAVDDNFITDEDTALIMDVLANDSDPADLNGGIDPTTVTIVSGPFNGTASVNVDGTITYDPTSNYNGPDSLQYVVCDLGFPLPTICDTAYVFITVLPVNDAPVVNDPLGGTVDTLYVVTSLNVPITVCLLAFDSDGDPVDVTNYLNGPNNGLISGLSNNDTCFTYTPDPGFIGMDTVDIVFCDDQGACDTVNVVITVLPNTPPVITDNGGTPIDTLNVSTLTDVPLLICLTAIDAEGDTLDATATLNGPANGSMSGVNDGDTCVTYTPDPGFFGTDTVTVVVCDQYNGCDTVVVVITVIPNQPPVIVDENGTPIDSLAVTTPEDQPIIICLNAIDPDGDAVDVTGATFGPLNGTLTGLNDNDTCFTYIPNANYNGPDTVTIQVCDGLGACDVITVVIDVTPVNDPPLATDDVVSTNEDTAITVDVINNDNDDADGSPVDTASVTVIGGPQNGTATVNGDGTITYVPGLNFNGSDSIIYVICDTGIPLPAICDTAVVFITVTPINDAPVITDNGGIPIDTLNVSTLVDVPILICFNVTDVEGDALDASSTLNGPTNGSMSGVNDGDTCVTYTPDPGFVGTDTVTVVICDQFNGCDTVVVVITVLSNQPPVIVDENGTPIDTLAITTPEDQPIIICLNAIDPDGDAVDVTGATFGPLNGTLTGLNDNDTCFTYIPNANYNGPDTVTIQVCDGLGACDVITIIIDITPVNDPPLATDDIVSTNEDTAIIVDVINNDNDAIDGSPLDPTSVTVIGGPQDGTATVNGDGTITYVPGPNFNGSDSLIYVICDTGIPLPAICDTAVVYITVTPVNDPPYVEIGGNVVDTVYANTMLNTSIIICLNAFDPEGDAVDVTAVIVNPTNGTATNFADGDTCFTYTPDPGYVGGDTLVITVCDNLNAGDTIVVIINVTDNLPPFAVDDTASVNGGGSVVIDNEGNDSDPEGDPFTTTVATAGNGTVVINGDGTLTYTPSPTFCGTDTISYTICDDNGACDTAIILVTVNCPPVAVDDSVSTFEDTSVIIDVVGNDSDPNGDPFSVTVATAGNGTVVINSDGTLTYSPDPNYCGTDVITYTICDTTGLCDTGMVTVEVICVNDPPIAVD
ncbi:MAG: tandem-95 repeat protein, partial [Flavobacteriales bacterium]|nr:tandem-95 repeat protein [Flavobacteriales bacterium]